MIFCAVMAPMNSCGVARVDKTQGSDFTAYPKEINEYEYYINQQDLAQLKQRLATDDEEAKAELYAEIFHCLGYSDAVVSNLGTDWIDDIMEEAVDITVSVQYIKSYANGTQEAMNKDECLRAAADLSPVNAAIGYMEITNTVVRLSEGVGWYQLYGMFTWLSTPSYKHRHTDTIALYVNNVTWPSDQAAFYSYMTYDTITTDSSYLSAHPPIYDSVRIDKAGSEKAIGEGLLCYDWDLPGDKYSFYTAETTTCKNFFFFVTGKAQLRLPTQVSFNLFTRYTHTITSSPFAKGTSLEFYSYGYKTTP